MKGNKSFSVAIPTYYSSEHISECLKSFIDIPKVNEIIINDDGSSYEEYKKLNKKIDGYGNIVEDKPEKTGNNDIDNMFKLNESREKAENTKFRSVDSYRPSGKFIYNMDFFNNEK